MHNRIRTVTALALLLTFSGAANADFGVGFKAGTLGLGAEGRWSPLPWLDLRVGANQYDLDTGGSYSAIDYDATLALDNYYVTGNLRFPLSPFRLTAGAFSNGNELQLVSADTGGANLEFGGTSFTPAEVSAVYGTTSFGSTSPYVGVGYDFELLGKVGLNLDFGVLWQGEPMVALAAEGSAADSQVVVDALATEELVLENDLSDYKAWPVVSMSFVYNF